ncbi:alpha/beta fold hydrolase [Caldimonas brevitalea]|uniref:Haloalkane dehalogenase n=1 Tax=Caldimonas brevitalea TaxID=413882 RepID=A0A0G3BLM4_9BURK|nr:alpha/beta hydrolase [Caldimonas brevitalea]AKJ27460.1 haloalkane dehalogenase [Caldimonas brevitalea]
MSTDSLRLAHDGLQFDALSSGPDDGPLVVCLHGFPQFADAWDGVMPLLAGAGYRVVAVDQRGYSPGARPRDVAAYHVDRLVADVLAWADTLGRPRFHLAGHDWGGAVAWRLAERHPQRLLSLTVLSTPHPAAFKQALAEDADQRRRSIYVALFRLRWHLAERLMLARGARVLRQAYRGKVPAPRVEQNVQRLRQPGALTGGLNWYRAADRRAEVGPVQVPTLYIWGSADQALGATAAEATRQHVTGPYRYEALAGASHWLLEEQTQRVADLMLEHLAQHGGASG